MTDNSEKAGWEKREISRLQSLIYKPLPWATELEPIDKHYAFVSTKNPELVAYTQSSDKGERDIQTQIKPGRYLKKFYPALADWEIQKYADLMSCAKEVRKLENNVHFATTGDEIVAAYMSQGGPASCMTGKDNVYESSVHPVYVYGAGDLALAYIYNGQRTIATRSPIIAARVICWPEKKMHGRIYGDNEYADKLKNALRTLGYGQTPDLSGARLIRMEEEGRFVCPCLDNDMGIKDEGSYLILIDADESDYDCESQNGMATDKEACSNCGDRCSKNDISYDNNGDCYCADCYDDLFVYCDKCDDPVKSSNSTHLEVYDIHVCECCLDEGYSVCEKCEWMFENTDVIDDFCPDCRAKAGFADCGRCDVSTHPDNLTPVNNKRAYCPHCAKNFTDKCRDCGKLTNVLDLMDDCCDDCRDKQDEQDEPTPELVQQSPIIKPESLEFREVVSSGVI